jgi:hypothetical protein
LSRAIAIAGRPVRRSGSAASAVQTAHEQRPGGVGLTGALPPAGDGTGGSGREKGTE